MIEKDTYHFIIDLVEVDFTYFVDYVFTFECHKCKTWKEKKERTYYKVSRWSLTTRQYGIDQERRLYYIATPLKSQEARSFDGE